MMKSQKNASVLRFDNPQWTGFYMIPTSVMKALMEFFCPTSFLSKQSFPLFAQNSSIIDIWKGPKYSSALLALFEPH